MWCTCWYHLYLHDWFPWAYQWKWSDKAMVGRWSTEETWPLINIWGEQSIQSKLEKVHWNHDVFERIVHEISDIGYEKSWQQCRTKIKNNTQKYREVIITNGAITLVTYFVFRLKMAKTLVVMVGNIGHSSNKWMLYWEPVLPQPQWH